MAINFGKTWWGSQWLNALNNIDYGNRLPRGSSYARKGAVIKIDTSENRITAKVRGSRPTPYKVDIVLPEFSEPELHHFTDALAKRPAIISKLLNRELDPEILHIAREHGLQIFPGQWNDFSMNCSCPDWAVPCKHLAAVIYKISAEIDNNPFLVFQLHNVDLIAKLNSIGIFVSDEKSEIPRLESLYFDRKPGVAKISDYDAGKSYAKLSYAGIKDILEPLVALLSDEPVFYHGYGNFKDKYRLELKRIAKIIQSIIQGKKNLGVITHTIPDDLLTITVRSEQRMVLDNRLHAQVELDGRLVPVMNYMTKLVEIPTNNIPDYQSTTASLHTTLHLALHLLANGAVIPQLVRLPDESFSIRWLPAMLSKEVRQLVFKLQESLPSDIFIKQKAGKVETINKDPAVHLLSVFMTGLVHGLGTGTTEDLFLDLFFTSYAYSFDGPGENALSGGVAAWLQKYYITAGNYKPRIVVEEGSDDTFEIFILIHQRHLSLESPASLKDILTLKSYEKNRFEILRSITPLSSFIKGLDDFINSKEKHCIRMNVSDFAHFLFDIIPAIELLDIDILLPKSLKSILKPKPSISVSKKPGRSFLRLDKLLSFDWRIAIGEHILDEEEFARLMRHADGLIKYKSQYIYAGKEEIEKLFKHFNSSKSPSSFEILRSVLSEEYHGAAIAVSKEVRELIRELTEVDEVNLPSALQALMRPYQHRGYSWMYRNSRIGFGSVIADDMGLGKTVQVIATVLKFKEEGSLDEKKALVVVPTGLLTNWQSEIEKFAPSLQSHIYHGSKRKVIDDFDVMLTSYGIVRSDAVKLKKMAWHTLVIDEAQNIKNQDTAQTKAVKSIKADNYIAMSGTPVENRLSELWSVFDFSIKGLLGSAREFDKTYAAPIEVYNVVEVAHKLKLATSPFMMRRLKTDKTIISDLPDKIEMDCMTHLVSEQAGLYEKTLGEAMKQIEGINSSDKKGLFARQGLVLQMILALKQICNHPTLFLKNNNLDPTLSGKLAMLFDKLDAIIENREKALIFTQFAEMGKLLQHFIAERYGDEPMFYHGGSTIRQRNEMVDRFQTNPADKLFVLSLKAAGTGLNLTAANHVIHYDLWWNPAVEVQATDRAYRIGQKSDVMVHRFITKNTFEEHINEMIQSKKALAEMTVATGENWIGNLSNKELKGLFAFSG